MTQYTCNFTMKIEFYGTGFYYLFSDKIHKIPKPSIPNDSTLIPVFTDVIMVTAANSAEELKKAFAYGAVDYLIKPFEFERFEEAYKKHKIRKEILYKDNNIDQSQIDIITSLKISHNSINLPKGLNKRTLEKIIEFLKENSGKIWTLREIAYEIKISNVTIKKYMDYLESVDMLHVEATSGNVGRPELKYSLKT